MKYLAGALLAASLCAQTQFFPLSEVRPGLRGVGRTVFSADRVEEFQVEILGVLENAGPRQSLVLARLSGGPLEHIGVLQGMSGSPVYIDGRLMGAVSASFPLAKEPIAGIRPIQEMLRPGAAAGPAAARARPWLDTGDLAELLPKRAPYLAGNSRLADIATPIHFSGLTGRTIEVFSSPLRALGLEPCQGTLGGAGGESGMGDPTKLRPGSMISVLLVAGDMNIGADGTVTHIDGHRVYAFGHRFLSLGNTEMPFTRAEVLTLLPNLASSFKISAAREPMGAITADHSAAVVGALGKQADTVPVLLAVSGRRKDGPVERTSRYRLRMVRDRLLSPFLLQMACYSAIDATERTLGAATITTRGRLRFASEENTVRIANTYAGEVNAVLQASLAAAVPLAYAMQSGFDTLRLREVELDLNVTEGNRKAQIEQVWASRQNVEPGETIELRVLLSGDGGAELTRQVSYRVPPGAAPGVLQFTVAEATIRNLMEFHHLLGRTPSSSGQVISFLNGLGPNTRAYVRVSHPQPAYHLQGHELPAPPPSVARILQRLQPGPLGFAWGSDSKIAELEIDTGDMVVSGSKSVQVEVKP